MLSYKSLPALIVLVATGTACTTLGPRTIQSDRFNYNQAGAESAKEQMLLNIIRLRYGEPLYFIEISSMLSQFSLEAGGSVSAWQNDLHGTLGPKVRAAAGVDGDASQQTTFGGNLSYSDKPTITYRPIQGEEFSKRVMAPIPPEDIINLAKSGWSIDRLLSCCVQSINGITNRSLHDSTTPTTRDASKFERLAVLLKKLQDYGNTMFAVEWEGGVQALVMYVPDTIPGLDSELRETRELLGYPLTGNLRIRVTSNAYQRSTEEMAIQTRSLLAILYAIAQEFSIPPAHAEDKESAASWMNDDALKEKRWLRIEHSRLPQRNPFAQVYYNGYWYYIAKEDWSSKRTFALFTYLFSLQATNVAGATAPVVTVGAGR